MNIILLNVKDCISGAKNWETAKVLQITSVLLKSASLHTFHWTVRNASLEMEIAVSQ